MIMKKMLLIILGILCIAVLGAAAWLYWAMNNTEMHTVEFTPKDGFVYFTDVNDPITLDVNLVKGPQKLSITMDNGERLDVRILRDGKEVYQGEIVYTGELDLDIPEDGAYQMTLSGVHASGSLKYVNDGEKEDRGMITLD